MKAKNILTIIKKELLLYFISFSNFLVFAAVLTVTMVLFFNNFYMLNAATLEPLFNLFPWVFALLVPAVTMGIIAQERRARTLQYLLANPVTEADIVVGKFFGALTFLSIVPLLTLTVGLSYYKIAPFDWGVIASGYIATIILMAMFLAVDLYISSLFKNQLAAFVLGFVINFFLIVLGTDLINNMLPVSLLGVVSQISPMNHFLQLTRGFIQVSDLLYFLQVIVAMILLTIWQIRLLKTSNTKLMISWKGVSIYTLALGLLASTFLVGLVPGEYDLTTQKLFTPAQGTYDILKDLPGDVTVDLYLSKDLPVAFRPRLDDAERLLAQLSIASGGKVKLQKRYPTDDTQAAEDAGKLGISAQSFSVVSQNEYQAKEGFFGLNVKYGDQDRPIPFIGETSDLEYRVVSLIYDLVNPDKAVVTYIKSSLGAPLGSQAPGLEELLKQSYQVKEASLPAIGSGNTLKDSEIDGKVIVLVGVDQAMSSQDAELIEKKVKAGSSLIVFDSGIALDSYGLTAKKKETIGVNEVLQKWGIKINGDVVFDEENANLITFNSAQGKILVNYPFWPNVGVNQDIPLLKDINSIMLPWASSIEISDNTKVHPLLFTGDRGGVQVEGFDLSPNFQPSSNDLSRKNVGVFQSRTGEQGAVIVVGSDQFFSDQFLGQSNNNLLFASQLFDLASQNDSLASIRIKNRVASQLVFTSAQEKDNLHYFNLAAAPVLALLIGGGFMYWRRQKMLGRRLI
jgi:ABC-2 type transport system permease protein